MLPADLEHDADPAATNQETGGSQPRPHVVGSCTPQLECREGISNPLLPPVCITRFSEGGFRASKSYWF